MYRFSSFLLLTSSVLLTLAACHPVDRSDEQPFAPTVMTLDATSDADSLVLRGQVLASPNSPLTACGFTYGNDTLRKEVKMETPADAFEQRVALPKPGTYYVVAYAANGVGTGYGDTLRFVIP